jgi:IQ calmodulin-binding motif
MSKSASGGRKLYGARDRGGKKQPGTARRNGDNGSGSGTSGAGLTVSAIANPKLLCLQSIVEDVMDRIELVASLSLGTTEAATEPSDESVVKSDTKRGPGTQHRRRSVVPHLDDLDVTLILDSKEAHGHPKFMSKTDVIASACRQRHVARSFGLAAARSMLVPHVRRLRQQMMDLLHHAMNELVVSGACPSLWTAVRENERQVVQAEELSKTIQQAARECRELERVIDAESKQYAQQQSRVHIHVKQLRTRLANLRHELAIVENVTAKEYAARAQTRRRVYKIKQVHLQERLEQLRLGLEREQNSHSFAGEFLSRRHNKAKDEYVEWDKRFDDEVLTLAAKVEDLQAKREATLSKLAEAEEVYKREMALKNARDSKIEQERIEKERRELAAITIQKKLRGFLARREFLRTRHAGKTKGKKKKKGKK